jgi:hypothetical protein
MIAPPFDGGQPAARKQVIERLRTVSRGIEGMNRPSSTDKIAGSDFGRRSRPEGLGARCAEQPRR